MHSDVENLRTVRRPLMLHSVLNSGCNATQCSGRWSEEACNAAECSGWCSEEACKAAQCSGWSANNSYSVPASDLQLHSNICATSQVKK
ncbi:hypothetical protein AB205_0098790 [Aquarana catesbeiana]|uniref:Uncharacterized protein n=1 Tax=Aquarana catesbeiana TaxID=8400 RepID=A0A2G9RES1_AQUCT|nr:hypothetical protein AB205_0098790 [Aquarana catesbeiana]